MIPAAPKSESTMTDRTLNDKPMISRRNLLLGGAALIVLSPAYAGYRYWFAPQFIGVALTPPEALARVQRGQITLIDIRRPDEWARTGSPQGAVPLDMRRDDFIEALSAAVNGNRDAPIALICAGGVRSARLGNRLLAAGFGNVLDVPEGMMGSSAGPGWLARGLPVIKE